MVATDVKTTFERLRDEWYRRTSHHSNMSVVFGDPAYQQIIDLGPEIIPFIFAEVKANRGLWLDALATLTGENPVPEAVIYTAEKKKYWLEWGKVHGFAD